jgi:hypothetical protein
MVLHLRWLGLPALKVPKIDALLFQNSQHVLNRLIHCTLLIALISTNG